jgi:hypothetical protein
MMTRTDFRWKHDPEKLLFETIWLLRSHKGQRALDCLFRAASSKEPPHQWCLALKSLAKQVRRALGYEERARRALRAGNHSEALRLVRRGEDILGATPKGLRVDHPGHGGLDYAALVLAAAKEMLGDTRGRALDAYQHVWSGKIP